VAGLAGGVDGQGVVGAAGHRLAEVVEGQAAGEDRDVGEVAQQPAALG
jgi:hypothetical protein